jgi:hypothetical protein
MERFASLAVASADALTGNVSPVGGGVVVTLTLEHGGGIAEGPLTSASTDSSGHYTLSLRGGTDPATTCRYMLSVGSAANDTLTRAFVTSLNEPQDVDFASEAAVRLILERVGQGFNLCEFSGREIRDLIEAIRSLPGDVTGANASEVNSKAFAAAAGSEIVQEIVRQAIEPTATPVRSPRFTFTKVLTPTVTPRPATARPTATFTATLIPPLTSTPSRTSSPTITRSHSPTFTPTSTPPRVDTATPSATPTPTATATQTEASTLTPTGTVTPTGSQAATATPTRTSPASATPTPTHAATVTATISHTAAASATTTATPTTPVGGVERVCNLKSGATASVVRVKTTLGLTLSLNLSGHQTWVFAPADTEGVRNIAIPASGTHFNSVVVLGIIKFCIRPNSSGTGILDCDGGALDYDISGQWDHNTSVPPGANGGHPQDPECDDSFTNPGDLVSHAGIEGAGKLHPGVCNGPIRVAESGSFVPGGMKLTENLIATILTDPTLGCPADDAPLDTDHGDIALSGVVTTGKVTGTVFDAMANVAPWALTAGNLTDSVNGIPYGCDNIDAAVLSGGKLALSIPAIDLGLSTFGNADIVATLQIVCQ